jgi:glycosyltransferase involved in cell wall biosynthesis
MSLSNAGGRVVRVVGVYPEKLMHRRNTDHLYYHALRDLYGRLNLPFEVVPDRAYNLKASFYYQLANRARRMGLPGVNAWALSKQRTLPLPDRLIQPDTLYHGGFFGEPDNVGDNIVIETEFYDFEGPESGPLPRRKGELAETDLQRLRAVLVRTPLSKEHFCRKYDQVWHPLVHVVPFHMPYLERWEKRDPIKPDQAKTLSFIFVGNQARRKGLDIFVRFAEELRRIETSRILRFIVVSNFQDGTDFNLTGMEVHQGLGGAQVQDLMEQAHFLMLPTRADSHPKVCYEAAATGCGLILSDIRPLRDVWAGGGLIFPIAEGEGAMPALATEIAAHGDPGHWGRRNRQRFLTDFCPTASVKIHRRALGL